MAHTSVTKGRGLVYALAGYNPTTEEVIQAFKVYVQEEARKYESEFPPELYQRWHDLYGAMGAAVYAGRDGVTEKRGVRAKTANA